MVLGPLPRTNFQMILTSMYWSKLHTISLASQLPSANGSIAFVDMPLAEAFNPNDPFRISFFTCEDFCTSYSECGTCTATEFCGWCTRGSGGSANGTCMVQEHGSARCSDLGGEWTPPGDCCAA